MSTEDDKINTGALATLVAVGTFAMIAVATAVTALVRHDISAAEAEKNAGAADEVAALKAKQKAALNAAPHYIDVGAGKVAMPIDMAASLVVQELRRDPNSATPPPPPSAAPPATAESAAAPAGDKKPGDAKATDAKGGDKKAPKSNEKPAPATPPAPAAPAAPAPNH